VTAQGSPWAALSLILNQNRVGEEGLSQALTKTRADSVHSQLGLLEYFFINWCSGMESSYFLLISLTKGFLSYPNVMKYLS
jgi:hypothetical protein